MRKVTPTILDIALRMCNIEIHKSLLHKVLDVIVLLEQKGGEARIRDITDLQESWKKAI